MGTIVTMEVVRSDDRVEQALDRAFGWFHEIEARCTRFDERSELRQLGSQPGISVQASAIVFEAVRFALRVAAETGGAFDPTGGSYRDVRIDEEKQTITVLRPLTIDLGAIAKGLAVDAAARELAPFRDFAIDAGGDLYLGGCNPQGETWAVGVRHPRREREVLETLRLSDCAVCTSGDYERGQHIFDPRIGGPAAAVASATVVAPGAMLADALATAVFVLGPQRGIELLERMEVEGLIVTPELQRFETRGLRNAA